MGTQITGFRLQEPRYRFDKPGGYGGNAALNLQDYVNNGGDPKNVSVRYTFQSSPRFQDVFGFAEQDFAIADNNHDGQLTFAELAQLYQNTELTKDQFTKDFSTVISENNLSQSAQDQMFRQVDLNQDGKLNGYEIAVQQFKSRDLDQNLRISLVEHSAEALFEDIASTGQQDGNLSAKDLQYAEFHRLFDSNYARETAHNIATTPLEDKYGQTQTLGERYQQYKKDEGMYYLKILFKQLLEQLQQNTGAPPTTY